LLTEIAKNNAKIIKDIWVLPAKGLFSLRICLYGQTVYGMINDCKTKQKKKAEKNNKNTKNWLFMQV
jgi:hypothetical protein